jgi:hypothetical protein
VEFQESDIGAHKILSLSIDNQEEHPEYMVDIEHCTDHHEQAMDEHMYRTWGGDLLWIDRLGQMWRLLLSHVTVKTNRKN